MNTSTVKKSSEIAKLNIRITKQKAEIHRLNDQIHRSAKAKSVNSVLRKHWKMEWKNFVVMMGEISIIPGRFKRRKARQSFRTRWSYAMAILKAPRLTKKGTLEDYLKKFPGKNPKISKYSYFTRISGMVQFKCRAVKANLYFAEILCEGKWIKEPEALKKLSEPEKEKYSTATIFED